MVEGVGHLYKGIQELRIFTTGCAGSSLLCCHDENGALAYQSKDGTCYKSVGLVENESDILPLAVQCLERGVLSFIWEHPTVFQMVSVYTEDGILYRKETITSGECQLSLRNLPKGIYLYVLTTSDKIESSGKVYVK